MSYKLDTLQASAPVIHRMNVYRATFDLISRGRPEECDTVVDVIAPDFARALDQVMTIKNHLRPHMTHQELTVRSITCTLENVVVTVTQPVAQVDDRLL
jgi:hypothetical protein